MYVLYIYIYKKNNYIFPPTPPVHTEMKCASNLIPRYDHAHCYTPNATSRHALRLSPCRRRDRARAPFGTWWPPRHSPPAPLSSCAWGLGRDTGRRSHPGGEINAPCVASTRTRSTERDLEEVTYIYV